METRLFALFVGIDQYLGGVQALTACIRDVRRLQKLVRDQYQHLNPEVQTLLDSEATRENIISTFRKHLGQAGPDDVVWFHFSGHGSRQRSAIEFHPFFPDQLDETLVCHDSRAWGGLDLADKEFAVLLYEIGIRNAEILVTLDCCHSDSLTRFGEGCYLQRSISSFPESRPLDRYLNGWYAASDRVDIPQRRHIAISACTRFQRAQEVRHKNGIFTDALCTALEAEPGLLYAELLQICRSRLSKSPLQTPVMAALAGADIHREFLSRLPSTQVPKQHAWLRNVEPVRIWANLGQNVQTRIKGAIGSNTCIRFVQHRKAAELTLQRYGEGLILFADRTMLQGTMDIQEATLAFLALTIRRVGSWYQLRGLNNLNETTMAGDVIAMNFDTDAQSWEQVGSRIRLPLSEGHVRGRFRVTNRSSRQLHILLLHLSREFAVTVCANEPLQGGSTALILDTAFFLPHGVVHGTDTFKLFVSTDRIDGYLFSQEKVRMGKWVSAEWAESVESLLERDIGENPFAATDWRTFLIEIDLQKD